MHLILPNNTESNEESNFQSPWKIKQVPHISNFQPDCNLEQVICFDKDIELPITSNIP